MASDGDVPAPRERSRALVVGEHAGMRGLLKVILGGLALDVDEVSSSHQRLDSVGHGPRVVVVDVDLAYAQGMVVWHRLRRDPQIAHIPSVFLVESGNEFVRDLATLAGATVCLDKPFDPRQLRTIVTELLGSMPESGASGGHPASVPRPAAR